MTFYSIAAVIFFVCVSLFMLHAAEMIVTINLQVVALVGAIAGFVCAIIRVVNPARD